MIITGGNFRSRKIKSPKEKIVKPTLSKVRESIFNVLSNMIEFEGKNFLDLFSGSGIMGFEAISRGFSKLTCIDNNIQNVMLLKENAKILGIDANILKYDALKYLKNHCDNYDIIFLDPPYESDYIEKCLSIIKETQNKPIIVIEILEEKEIDLTDFVILQEKKYGICKIYFLKQQKS